MVGVMARTNPTAATAARSEPTLADLLERLPAADRPLRLAGELGLPDEVDTASHLPTGRRWRRLRRSAATAPEAA